jgi:putative ABC transport system permease protein
VIEEPTLHYFVPLAPASAAASPFTAPRAIVMRIDPGRWNATAAAVQAVLADHFDPRVVRMGRMVDTLEPQLRPWRLGAQLFTAFGLLALLVTVVGVFSVMSYSVSQRTHEMGVRVALGARLADVLRLVVGEGLAVIALGVVLGIGIALALGRLIESLLYGVTPRDPVAMAAAAAVLIAAGVGASLVPAWRAAKVDPVRALSAE